MQRLLITGATGFLGGAIGAALIDQPEWPRTLFLVRAENAAEGVERLRRNLAGFGLSPQQLDKLEPDQILCGDLTQVEAFAQDPRLDEIQDVIHCGAVASFSNHPLIWPTNVDGTLALARTLASRGRLRRFLHVGTGMACGTQAPNPVPEDYQILHEDEEHLVEYTRSKSEVERLLAQVPGLPLVVLRPSIVVGHTREGCRPSDSIFWVFRMALALGEFTCAFDQRIDVIPVDYFAQCALHLWRKTALAHNRYHVSAGPERSCSFREIDAALAAATGRAPLSHYREVDFHHLAARAPEFPGIFGPCNRRLMLRAIKLYGYFSQLGLLFDHRRLTGEGLEPPPRFDSYAGRCEITSQDKSIAEQMRADFK